MAWHLHGRDGRVATAQIADHAGPAHANISWLAVLAAAPSKLAGERGASCGARSSPESGVDHKRNARDSIWPASVGSLVRQANEYRKLPMMNTANCKI